MTRFKFVIYFCQNTLIAVIAVTMLVLVELAPENPALFIVINAALGFCIRRLWKSTMKYEHLIKTSQRRKSRRIKLREYKDKAA